MSGLLAVAFAAGLLAPVNPCGFALLPALLASCIPTTDDANTPRRLAIGLGSGLALALGFAGTLTLAAVIVAAGLRALTTLAPWLAAAVGAVLVVLGVVLLLGRSLPLRLPSVGLTAGGHTGALRLVLFGIGYAVASLACTLAVLLAVVAQALTAATVVGMVTVFAAYAAGAAILLLLLAVSAAVASGLAARAIRRLLPALPRITGALLAVSGGYLLLTWLPAATGGTSPVPSLAPLASHLSSWINTHQTGTLAVAVAVLATAALIVAADRIRHARSQGRRQPADDCCQPQPPAHDRADSALGSPGHDGHGRS